MSKLGPLILLTHLCLSFSIISSAKAASIQADFETTPIKQGLTDSDDAAYYHHRPNPNDSEILAVSKCDETPSCGGLYVYDLTGTEKQRLDVGKLNNIDTSIIAGETIAFASNREDLGVSVFNRRSGSWQHQGSLATLDEQNRVYEPYGLCSYQNQVAVSSKQGKIYLYRYDGENLDLTQTIDLAEVAAPYDNFIKDVVIKTATAKNKTHKLQKYLKQRFVAEGCVFHQKTGDLYIAQENLGVWRYRTEGITLIKQIQGPYAAPENQTFTNDVEGIAIYTRQGRDYLVLSSQGISKILFFEMDQYQLVASNSFYLNDFDPVTETDGVLAVSASSDLYPEGFLVLHDDENQNNDGTLSPANYKIISMSKLSL